MKRKANSGFTLAEMLIVVAIVVILMGVGFVAVQNHQRSMTQLEYDAIAKELFIAAQNHITAAESQGYLSTVTTDQQCGTKSTISRDEGKDVYFIVVNNGTADHGGNMLGLMLPFGAIDATIYSGSFIIRYQLSTARILDVFYNNPGRISFLTTRGVSAISSDDYTTLMGEKYRGDGSNQKRERRFYSKGVVGWHGGEEGLPSATVELKAPEIVIHNEDRLWVKVTDTNGSTGSLRLIIKGVTSGAELYFDLQTDTTDNRVKYDGVNGEYSIVLDDITEDGLQFSKINDIASPRRSGEFIEGENITVEAVAFNNSAISNIAYSGRKTTNSLFADIEDTDSDGKFDKASIAYIRHLENLDVSISNLVTNHAAIIISSAEQVRDLDWKNFQDNTSVSTNGVFYDNGETITATNRTYKPVEPTYTLAYDGAMHRVSSVPASGENAGMFGSSSKITGIKNLELLDFTVNGTGSAGALAGKLTGTNVENVLARNTTNSAAVNVTATGNAGGLIGSATNCTVEKSAAALIVQGGTSTGGLIGTASEGTTVTACYSGGHTKEGSYEEWIKINPYDVAGATAGGLIGTAGNTTVVNSYSTCSVSGTTYAGGFVGNSTGTITHCYATGKVDNSLSYAKAFVGSGSPTIITTDGKKSYYFETVNGDMESGDPGIEALDATAKSYNDFVGAPSDWKAANPYDETLEKYYQVDGSSRYNLQTVEQLGASFDENDEYDKVAFVRTHYGDWPAPEILVENVPNS